MATLTNDSLVQQMNRQSDENLKVIYASTDTFMKNLLTSPARFASENALLVKVHDEYFTERASNVEGAVSRFVTNTLLSRWFLIHLRNR